jgi:hypothetical protein
MRSQATKPERSGEEQEKKQRGEKKRRRWFSGASNKRMVHKSIPRPQDDPAIKQRDI